MGWVEVVSFFRMKGMKKKGACSRPNPSASLRTCWALLHGVTGKTGPWALHRNTQVRGPGMGWGRLCGLTSPASANQVAPKRPRATCMNVGLNSGPSSSQTQTLNLPSPQWSRYLPWRRTGGGRRFFSAQLCLSLWALGGEGTPSKQHYCCPVRAGWG